MKGEDLVVVVESREMFEFMAPIIERELSTHRIVHHDDPREAFAFLHDHAGPPVDLIFADWDLVGPEFIQAVRREHDTRYTPLIVLSDSDADEVVAAAMRAGASDHLFKPFLDKGLVHKIQRVTRSRELRRLHRIHPATNLQVDVARQGAAPCRLAVEDISIGGCRLRAPLPLSRDMAIYDTASLEIPAEAGPIRIEGRLIRIAEDPDNAPESVFVTYGFGDLAGVREALGDLLESLRARWEEEH